jgi:putative heme-binding domain-containing protein
LQLACSLGEWRDEAAGDALGRIAVANAHDPYITAAVLSSAVPHATALVNAVLHSKGPASEKLTGPLLKLTLALNERTLIARLLEPALTPESGQFNAGHLQTVAAFLDALARRNSSVQQWVASPDDALNRELRNLDRVFVAARALVPDAQQPIPLRVAAADVLGRTSERASADIQLLTPLLTPSTPSDLQRAGLHAISMTGNADVPKALLEGWLAHVPEIRGAVIDELLGRESWTLELLNRIEQGDVATLDIGVVQRDRLLKHRAQNVRALAKKVFALAANPDRQRVIDEYRPALALAADAQRGREAFARVCTTCHQLEGVGREIGPNLNSVRGHSPEKLLTSILDPSREVEPRYLAYTCTLQNGDELYGLVASETGNGIEMTLTDGTSKTVLRGEIQSLHSGRVSLMPDGLEGSLTKQEVADVIAYLRSAP